MTSIYSLNRAFFDWCFENPESVKPNHVALYYFIIEHCNRLGWKSKFGLPSSMAMEAIGMHSYNTYKKALYDLVDWGFIRMIEKSKNQYSSNIIALVNFDNATDKALDKAIMKHVSKDSECNMQSNDSIDIPITNLNQNNNTNLLYRNRLLSELTSSDVPNEQYFEFALSFWNLFRENLIEAGTSTKNIDKATGKWIDTIRLIIEVDKKTPQELEQVFNLLQENLFWKKNIMSIDKLREKFDMLIMEKRPIDKGGAKNLESEKKDNLQKLQNNALNYLHNGRNRYL